MFFSEVHCIICTYYYLPAYSYEYDLNKVRSEHVTQSIVKLCIFIGLYLILSFTYLNNFIIYAFVQNSSLADRPQQPYGNGIVNVKLIIILRMYV